MCTLYKKVKLIEITPLKWHEKKKKHRTRTMRVVRPADRAPTISILLFFFFFSVPCLFPHSRIKLIPSDVSGVAVGLRTAPVEERSEGGRRKSGGAEVKPVVHSQASLLSKLDRPMAKAWRAHMG